MGAHPSNVEPNLAENGVFGNWWVAIRRSSRRKRTLVGFIAQNATVGVPHRSYAHRVRFPPSRFTESQVKNDANYCVPPPVAETPSTICVPLSNWISCFAPSRMLEA
jgi:hypothetical protein